MRAGAGRAGGLADVVRAQLERCQDHPNTGRDARVDEMTCLDFSAVSQETGRKKKGEKRKLL